MATATSTITPSLTPSQQAAREFWRQAGADGMPPFYVMSQYYAQLSANSDNLPAVTAALEQLLTGLGYATDVDTVFAELTAGQGEELGYWAGRYCLFDSDGNRFDLVVGRDGATLTVPPALIDMTSLPAGTDIASVTVLNSVGFSDGMLQLANANALLPRNIALLRLQASLSFSLPVSDATLDAGAAAFQSTAPLCKGTFVVSGGGSAGLRPVNGKRGAWTQAGVNQTADGDPKEAWYGQYVLLDVTDVTAAAVLGVGVAVLPPLEGQTTDERVGVALAGVVVDVDRVRVLLHRRDVGYVEQDVLPIPGRGRVAIGGLIDSGLGPGAAFAVDRPRAGDKAPPLPPWVHHGERPRAPRRRRLERIVGVQGPVADRQSKAQRHLELLVGKLQRAAAEAGAAEHGHARQVGAGRQLCHVDEHRRHGKRRAIAPDDKVEPVAVGVEQAIATRPVAQLLALPGGKLAEDRVEVGLIAEAGQQLLQRRRHRRQIVAVGA